MKKLIILALMAVSPAFALYDLDGSGSGNADYDSVNALIRDSLAALSVDSALWADSSGHALHADSATKYANIFIDTLLPWDSIPGADDSALSAVRDTLNADFVESLALYLPLADFDDSVATHLKDSLGTFRFNGDTIVATGDTIITPDNIRATAFYGDGSNLTGVAASGGAGDWYINFYPGGTFYSDSFPVFNLDTNLSSYDPVLQYSTTKPESAYVMDAMPDTLGDSVTLHVWARGVTQAATDTMAWIFRYSCSNGSTFATYTNDTLVVPCRTLGYSKHITKRKAVSDLGWVADRLLKWWVIRDYAGEPNDDLNSTANLIKARIGVERQ